MEENYYNLQLTGDQIKERLWKKIPSTTDEIEGGDETWILDCGGSKKDETQNVLKEE